MISPDLTLSRLAATTKKQAFEQIAEQAAGLFFGRADTVLSALQARERLGCTGIGGGIALPHVQIEGIKRMYGVLACLAQPVAYEAPDARPVDIIYVLLVPAGSRASDHLKAMAQILRDLKEPETAQALRAAAVAEDVRASQG